MRMQLTKSQLTTAKTCWDDLPDDVQAVISARVRRNLLAELSEEELRLRDLETDFSARSRQLGRSRRSYGAQLALFERRRRPTDVELQEEEARIRTRETDRLRKIEESLFPGVGREKARDDVEKARSAYTDRCIAVGFKTKFISPQERRRIRNGWLECTRRIGAFTTELLWKEEQSKRCFSVADDYNTTHTLRMDEVTGVPELDGVRCHMFRHETVRFSVRPTQTPDPDTAPG